MLAESTMPPTAGDTIDSPTEFDAMPEAERAALLQWIGENIQPAARYYDWTSYGLKHLYEADQTQYVSNGQFKGAMLYAGHRPRDTREKNWTFKICKPQRAYDAYFNGDRFKKARNTKEPSHVAA